MIEEYGKVLDNKINSFEVNLTTVKECLLEKDTYISTLENKIKELEEDNNLQNLKIDKLEKDNEENIKSINFLSDQLSKFKKHMLTKSINTFKCSKWFFEAKSERGLKPT